MSRKFDFKNGPVSSHTTTVDSGLREYMRSVFVRMFWALCVTGIVATVCVSSSEVINFMIGGFSMVLIFGTLGIVMYLSIRINKVRLGTANVLFWLYSALIGAFLSPLFLMYTGSSLANCFFVTALFFGGLSLLGYTTKVDLTSLGSFMIVGLICLIICSLVNSIFLHSSSLQLGLSAITLIIFAGLTAYDVQKIKMFYNPSDPAEISGKKAILGALSLYMDFINMFLALVRILGRRR